MDTLDAYGKGKYVIGSGDDAVYIDFLVHPRKKTVEFASTLDCNTGHFIQDFQKPFEVTFDDAVNSAANLSFDALMWCLENKIKRPVYKKPALKLMRDVNNAVKNVTRKNGDIRHCCRTQKKSIIAS